MKYTKINSSNPAPAGVRAEEQTLATGDIVHVKRYFDRLVVDNNTSKRSNRGKLTLTTPSKTFSLEGVVWLNDRSIAVIVGIFRGIETQKSTLKPQLTQSTAIYVIGNGFKGWLNAKEAKKINK